MKLLNDVITGFYAGEAWTLTIEIDTRCPEIVAEIEIGDGYIADTIATDAIELGIWLWHLGIVGADVDKLVDEVDAAQMFCFACS